jgi:hypothetical protein
MSVAPRVQRANPSVERSTPWQALRIGGLAFGGAAVASCAYYIVDPSKDGSSYQDRASITGSNLPHKGSAGSASADAVDDALRRSSVRRPGTGAAGS